VPHRSVNLKNGNSTRVSQSNVMLRQFQFNGAESCACLRAEDALTIWPGDFVVDVRRVRIVRPLPINLLVSEPRKNEKHMTGSAITAVIVLVVPPCLLLPLRALRCARPNQPSPARQTGDLSTVFDWQAPKSKGKTNAHVYHGGPKAND
jgi:hypothetical protein